MVSPFRALSPEVELILRCASVAPRDVDACASLASLDWTTVLAMARRHGMLPVLHPALEDHPAVPRDARRRLARHFATNAERNRRLTDARDAVTAALGAAGVDVVPFRSAALPSPVVELVDVDLLVHRRDVPAATRLLRRLRFAAEDRLAARDEAALVRTGSMRRFVAAGGSVVSLHWSLGTAAERFGPPLERWLPRRDAGPDPEGAAPSLTPAARLQALCVRGTVNRWQRLTWVRDVALLLRDMAPDQEEAAQVEARATGAARAVGLGVVLARTLLRAPSSIIDTAARSDPGVMSLVTRSLAEIAAPARSAPGRRAIARFHLDARERRRDRLAYAVRQVVTPTPSDVEAISLPSRLHALRYALRPVRLVATWLRARRARRAGAQLARFGPTPPHIIDAMLSLAGVTRDDTLLDVGAGDGRIVTRAAERTGCRAVGVEIDGRLAARARRRAAAAGVGDLVEIVCADVRDADLSRATVVTLYLNAEANLAVRPVLERQLPGGARIVSRNFTMGDWLPEESKILDEAPWGCDTLYLWLARGSAPAATGERSGPERAERPTA